MQNYNFGTISRRRKKAAMSLATIWPDRTQQTKILETESKIANWILYNKYRPSQFKIHLKAFVIVYAIIYHFDILK